MLSKKVQMRKDLEEQGALKPIAAGLEPLLQLYPQCPLGFLHDELDWPKNETATQIDVVKEVVYSLYGKRDRPAILVQTQGVYTSFASGKLYVMQDSGLTNLEAIKNYPDTEESLKLGAEVC
jgi:hypothetical protein